MTTTKICEALGDPKTKEEVLNEIYADSYVAEKYDRLPKPLKEEYVSFCMGNRGLKVSYDPIFKYIFNPEIHPERLSELLSLLIGEEVEVVEVLPPQSDRISDKSSLLIMDILVRLKSGELANVEIQKSGHDFQGERASCYSAELVMKELERKKKKYGAKFTFAKMQKVYTIVLIESSTKIYWDIPGEYVHKGKVTFDTGLNLEMLQEYIMVSLDVFCNMVHNKINKLDAWLYFIGSDSPRDIGRIIEAYPDFKEIYGQLTMLRYKTKELVEMYDEIREALRIADENAAKYKIERLENEVEEKDIEIDGLKKEGVEKDIEIDGLKKEGVEKDIEIDGLKKEGVKKDKKIEDLEREKAEQAVEIAKRDAEIARLKAQQAAKN